MGKPRNHRVGHGYAIEPSAGPAGPTGPAGADGADGVDGADGADGAPGPQNLFVQNTDPAMVDPGLWIQTGLGVGGADMTFWVEDGV